MPDIIDLTFDQLNAQHLAEGTPFFVGEDPDGNPALLLNVSLLNGGATDNVSTEDVGVVKFIVKLREHCYQAQIVFNRNRLGEDLLDAFPPSTVDGAVIDGAILQVDTIKSRIMTASATEITGATIDNNR